MDVMTRKCNRILTALKHARHAIPRAALKIIVESLVLLTARYCIYRHGSCEDMQVNRFRRIISFAARVVAGRRRHDPVSDTVG